MLNFSTFSFSFSIGCELLRLFGNVSVLRAPLESLFHRLLVTDHIATRIEIFKIIKEVNLYCNYVIFYDIYERRAFICSPLQVFSKPQRLLIIGGPFLVESSQESFPEPNEFGILRVYDSFSFL